MIASAIFMTFVAMIVFMPGMTHAGSLEPPETAFVDRSPAPTMHTLEDIYNKPIWRIMGRPWSTVCDL